MSNRSLAATAAPAQALSDLTLEGLVRGAPEWTRRWAAALVLATPLEEIRELPLAELAGAGPALCAGILRALASDPELEALTAGRGLSGQERTLPSGGLSALAAACGPRALVGALEALRGVLWEELLASGEQLLATDGGEPAYALAALGDRLAYVCSRVLAAVIGELAGALPAAGEGRAEDAVAPVTAPAASDELVVPGEEPVAPGEERAVSPAPIPAVIVDERLQGGEGEISVRDQRGEGPAAWVGAIGAQLQRYAVDQRPFAVLLLELEDSERLRDETGRAARGARVMEDALRLSLELWPATLARERSGRCWVIAEVSDRAGSERLEQRLRVAVASRSSGDGEPLTIVVGSALCPDDGTQAAALAAHADLALSAERAGGRPR